MWQSTAPDRRGSWRSAAPTIVAVLALVVSGCSSERTGSPGDGDGFIAEGNPIQSVSVSETGVWGRGRALAAVVVDRDTTLVVTTTGVFVVGPGDSAPLTLDDVVGTGQFGSTVISPDKTTVAVTWNSPTTVRLYDITGRSDPTTLETPPESTIRSVAFTTDGDLIADTSAESIRWSQGSTSMTRPDTTGETGTAALLADGTVVEPMRDTGSLAIVSSSGDAELVSIATGDASVLDLHAAPSGAAVAASIGAGGDPFERQDQIVVLDPLTLAERSVIDVGRAIGPSEWTITDSVVAVAAGSQVSVWDLDGNPLTVPPGLSEQPVRSLHSAGNLIVSVHSDGAIVAVDLDAGAASQLAEGGTALRDVTLDTASRLLVTVDHFGLLSVRDIDDSGRVESDDQFAIGETTGVAVSAESGNIGVSSSAGAVALLDPSLDDRWSFQAADRPVRVDSVAFRPHSDLLATGLAERVDELAFDDTVTLWDPSDRTSRFRVGGESEDVAGCAFFYNRIRFTSDGTRVAVTSHDYSVSILDAESGAVLQQIPPRPSTILDIAFTPDDRHLVVTAEDSMVEVWDTTTNAHTASYPAAMGGYLAIAMLPDGATMAVGDVTGTISLINVMNGELRRQVESPGPRTTTLVSSADGAFIAAPAEGSSFAIWSTADGTRLATVPGHNAPVTGLAFSPTGDWMVTSGRDGTIRTWSIAPTT